MFIRNNIRKFIGFILFLFLILFYSKYIYKNKIINLRYLEFEEYENICKKDENLIDIYSNYLNNYNYHYRNSYYCYDNSECEIILISYFFKKDENVLTNCGEKFVIILISFILSLILILLWILYYICYYKKLCCFNKHAKINCNKKFIYIFIFILNIILITGSIYCIILTHKFYINTNRITCSVFKLYDHLKNGDDKYRNEIKKKLKY